MPTATQESADHRVPDANRNDPSRWPLIAALAAGTVAFMLTLSLYLSAYSFFGDSGVFVSTIVFPGLIGSIAVGGNAHAFSLWIAAGINFIVYFLVVWMNCNVSRRVLRVFR